MDAIKAIEPKSIHQIQSGQVIVDLCSVAKELVENSLDASATSIEVRFKNSGLDSIEVLDNGAGIAKPNYENIALKHHTSKLSSYDDLSTLQTFGFRGEALSSLCALSRFHIITAQAQEAPKGARLDFETSGKLKSQQVAASQKGTIAVVEGLFERLPVRRKELEKNVKREYAKVLGLLQSYACISTGVKFTVKNTGAKAKNPIVFTTNGNASTRDNVANVYGSKTISALIPLNLNLSLPSASLTRRTPGNAKNESDSMAINVQGLISRPVFGEGRLTPDRQMFFVNSRPCGLPQIAKAFNEVYKSFNNSQSPFICADFHMDTNSYDVNVSPDKRTILLHDSANLVENLKAALVELFEHQDQTMPQSQLTQPKLPAFKKLNVSRNASIDSAEKSASRESSLSRQQTLGNNDQKNESEIDQRQPGKSLFNDFFRDQASTRDESNPRKEHDSMSKSKQKVAKALNANTEKASDAEINGHSDDGAEESEKPLTAQGEIQVEEPCQPVRDFNARIKEQETANGAAERTKNISSSEAEDPIPAIIQTPNSEKPNIIQNAFDRMRRKRTGAEIATITIGDNTIETVIGSQVPKRQKPFKPKSAEAQNEKSVKARANQSSQVFGRSLRSFVAPGTQVVNESDNGSEIDQSQDHDADNLSDSESSHEEKQQSSSGRSPLLSRSPEPSGSSRSAEVSSDDEYVDEGTKKAQEQSRVQELIRLAEEKADASTEESLKRAAQALKSRSRKDSTTQLIAQLDGTIDNIENEAKLLMSRIKEYSRQRLRKNKGFNLPGAGDEEERLSLTVSKSDFAKMRIAGQFNLGFIIAKRQVIETADGSKNETDDLFIIDQHASDEKYNFEKLQRETVVGNQRLVQGKTLDLTAVEEEIIMENLPALMKNGFIVDVDGSGEKPTGQRCQLSSLPLSKEVVFDIRDLEELIHLLSENPLAGRDSAVPRPTKVRKMFAMRACRSSIMIGKTLTERQMMNVVKHMGEIDKPWNCPHGRPTMRHLIDLNQVDMWQEGNGIADVEGPDIALDGHVWEQYVKE
ncbi:MAG: hypothetical protein Q9160_002872 [Pyrenula sp. 1 TL-2023]